VIRSATAPASRVAMTRTPGPNALATASATFGRGVRVETTTTLGDTAA
jgi:hypothetical protein